MTKQIDEAMIKETINELYEIALANKQLVSVSKYKLLKALEAYKASQWQDISTAPKTGEVFYIQYKTPFKWKPYSPKSQQFKRGIKGRWQEMNEYGGWGNASCTPEEWQPDLLNMPIPKFEEE